MLDAGVELACRALSALARALLMLASRLRRCALLSPSSHPLLLTTLAILVRGS